MNTYFLQKFFKRIRNNVLAGVFLIIPIAGSVFIIVKLFSWSDAALPAMLGMEWPKGVGFLVSLIIAYLLGVLAKHWLGRKIIATGNAIISNIPFINKIYLVLKQIIDTVTADRKKIFDRAVMIEFPRPNCYALGLVTSDTNAAFSSKTGRKLLAIFVPKVPNPTTGFLLYVPEEDVIAVDIPVESALKLVISGGILGADNPTGTRMQPVLPPQWNWMDLFGRKSRKNRHAADPRD